MLYLIESLGRVVKTEDVIDSAVLWWNLGFRRAASPMNSAEGGILFLCFLFHRTKAITVQTMRSKAAPVTPIAIAVKFNGLTGFVTNGLTDVPVEGLALAGEGVNERGGSVGGRNVDD